MDNNLHSKLQTMDFTDPFWWTLWGPIISYGSQTPPSSPPEPFEPKVFSDHPTFSLQFSSPFEPNSPSSTDYHAPVENNGPFSHQALNNQGSNISMPSNDMPSCAIPGCYDHHHHGALVDGNNKNEEKDDAGSVFDCRICLGMAKEPVVTPCGKGILASEL